ncbi:hypothetical protein RDABS01_023983 [Bienertia sinuspersici]
MEDSFTPLSLRRRGSKIPVDIYETPKGNHQSLVVSRDNDVLYFFFHNPQDWEAIVHHYNFLNFKGGLILLRPWSYTFSYKSINFTFSYKSMWVNAEGIPYILSTEEFAHKVFGMAGGVLDIDMESLMPGPRRYMRARVRTQLGKPLVPGCYIEYEPDKLLWVDFRYEGVFHFCKKCGIIGHDTTTCRRSRDTAEQDINARIASYSPPYEVVFGHAERQLYTNKIRGLPNTPSFRTTRVNLFTTPNSGRHWHPFTPHSDGRNGGSD